jgi:hypothetical protein
MLKSLKPFLMSAVCGGFVLAAATCASAAPLAVAIPQQDASLVQSVRHFGPPPGKECVKWTRRFNSAHGFGHRRCIHWK